MLIFLSSQNYNPCSSNCHWSINQRLSASPSEDVYEIYIYIWGVYVKCLHSYSRLNLIINKVQYALGNILSKESAQQLEKLYSLSICLKTVTVSKKPRYMFKGSPASALHCKVQPIHSMAGTASVPEVADDHRVPWQETCSWRGKRVPLLMGREVFWFLLVREKNRVNQTAFDWCSLQGDSQFLLMLS